MSEDEQDQIRLLATYGVNVANIFVDCNIPGSVPPSRREGFTRMISFIRDHFVTHVYTCELDRLGGNPADALCAIRDIGHLGVCVQSLSPHESWWNCDPSIHPLIIHVMAWCARQEHESRIERTRAGIRKARSEGKHCGRPFREIDWLYVESLHEKGMNYRKIAETISVPYITLIRRKKHHLRNMGDSSPGQGMVQ
ncbi:MAG: hypothetical protein A4E34_00360 [Methanoregula sp. PtaU1.Bin006]|nr:MAG: hypothetical protein A4E33_01586 [Methanoregula sp. PtaB.Bin085]OPY36182.1 MAG: hypothetical protein A4E34_00360 [Methanoregula sp. PtaU1.Bin006]